MMTHFTPEIHIKNLDVVSHICNSSTSARRWDARTGYLSEAPGQASFSYSASSAAEERPCLNNVEGKN